MSRRYWRALRASRGARCLGGPGFSHLALVLTALSGTLNLDASLQPFLYEEFRPAGWTRLGNGVIPQDEIALRVGAAAEKSPPSLRPPRSERRSAPRAIHPDGDRFDVLASRVHAARQEAAEPPSTDHHGRPALVADLVRRLRRQESRPPYPDHGPAFRIARAGQERAKPSAL
jgi:hypothetical protein